MTGCARCGECCDRLHTGMDLDTIRYLADHPEMDDGSAPFILAHWTPTGTVTYPDGGTLNTWRCDRYDPVTRLCTAHDERPPVCADFPWYHRKPLPTPIETYLRCSYWADIPARDRPPGARPLIPVDVVHSPEARA